jgi:hypothetical protein
MSPKKLSPNNLTDAQLVGGRQIRGCARWIAGRWPATLQQASSRALENPAIARYRFRALKVPPGTPRNDPGGTSGRRGASRSKLR